MNPRLAGLIAAAALVVAIGAPTFAGTKAGAVNVTSDCSLLQDNSFSGEILVFLHNPEAAGFAVEVTYHKTGDFVDSNLVLLTCTTFPGWYLYDTGISTSETGATSVQVWDLNGKSVGGDSFLAT